ncbi:DUF2264 domain-containing protein [uncultured Pseudokineococcus sp.]|uniref:DUF2264 domain-containing protein n=1 Tax=uncultured Pseudokineococcus sp. TaxID=1642928 RepID=UPI00262FDE93|nr:DUF2264 domain-containing protein [uncultured Pseudokineococcus sp.]
MLDLPAEDRDLSPGTGWTRAHWTAAADGLLRAAARYRSPRGGRLDLPGPPSRAGVVSDGLEGFARTFLLAALHAAGTDGEGHLPAYVEGLRSGPVGVDADGRSALPGGDPDAWPLVGVDGPGGQPMVESASVALGLLLARGRTWDLLDDAEQDRLERWLRRCLHGEPAPNNWYFFPLTVAAALEELGRGDAATTRAVDRGHELAEGWYLGEGWYSDGDGRMVDHYVGWAMHLYPVLVAHLRGDRAVLDRLGPRLQEFLGTYARTFDADGAPLHQGRSLTYRAAAVAPVALGALTGWTPLSPGTSRRLMSGALRHFLDPAGPGRGVLEDGLLTLGWHGPHRATLQPYSGPASPYWLSKAFLGLLLPATDPLWTAVEEEPPSRGPDAVVPVAPVGWLVQTTREDGLVRVHNHGADHVPPGAADGGAPDPLYARWAYSTRTGPTPVRSAPDGTVRLVVRGRSSARRRIHPLGCGEGWAASWHRPVLDGPEPDGEGVDAGDGAGPRLPSARVESVVLARGRWEVRVHRLRGVPDGVDVVESGWAVAGPAVEDVVATSLPSTGRGAPDGVLLRSSGPSRSLSGSLAPVRGWTTSRAARVPAGTAFGRWALVPELLARTPVDLLVSVASLTGGTGEDPPPRVEAEPDAVVVRWADGTTTLALPEGDGLPRVDHGPA